MLTGYKTGFQHKDIQSLEDLNLLSHKDLRGIKTRNSQATIHTNDSICRGFQKYTRGIPCIILFRRGRETVCKMFQTQRQ